MIEAWSYGFLQYGFMQKALLGGIAIALCCGLVGPFLVMDANAFISSTILYLSGNAPHSYPVGGYGFGMLLFDYGIIKNIHDFYPFAFWQFMMGVPVLVTILMYLHKKPTISRLMLGYAGVLFVFWYFSRYFNNSHIAYIGTLLSLGIIKQWDEQEELTHNNKISE